MELYTMANYYFKDKHEPERDYSITISDIASLLGYKGEELHIGMAIQLNNTDYFIGGGSIIKALEQLLFISDISYTLRSDTDISITVNNIKYEDKLIEKLVRLIK
jgi:hypothetical protein